MEMNFNDLQSGVRNINDGVTSGFANLNSTICHQQYDTAAMINGVQSAMASGFAGVDNAICTLGYQTAQSINGVNDTIQSGFNAANIVALQNQNALQTQIAECCCEEREAIAGLNYNLATQSCDTRNTIQNIGRDLIDNQNANTRAILEKLTAQEIAAKDAQISAQNQQIFGLQLAASQQAQNNYLVNAIAPKAVPAYQVPNPYNAYPCNTYASCNCNCNTGCYNTGCGC